MEPEAFERLIAPERDRLLAYLVGMTGDREIALDLAQETFLAAWQGFSTYRGEGAPLTWLVGIARRILLRWSRREGRRARLLAGAKDAGVAPAAPDAAVQEAERAHRVRRAVLSLPAERREAVVLRYFAGLSVADIARVTGTSEGTVKSRLARAREQLARLLAEDL